MDERQLGISGGAGKGSHTDAGGCIVDMLSTLFRATQWQELIPFGAKKPLVVVVITDVVNVSHNLRVLL